jgi:hypothetical protein
MLQLISSKRSRTLREALQSLNSVSEDEYEMQAMILLFIAMKKLMRYMKGLWS